MKTTTTFAFLAALPALAICFASAANAQPEEEEELDNIFNVKYTQGVIDSGSLSFGLTELPAEPEVTFGLSEGTSTGEGATLYGPANVLSVSFIFGDIIIMNGIIEMNGTVIGTLTEFDTVILTGGSIQALDYAFALEDTPTVQNLIVSSSPFLTITGTDIASG